MRILVAEDELLLRIVYEDFLADLGHDVQSAFDGQAALEALRAGRFDVLVTDLNMPRLDGFGLLRAVAAEFPAVVCVVASAFARESALPDLIATGARLMHHLVKPFDFAELARVVAEAERRLGLGTAA